MWDSILKLYIVRGDGDGQILFSDFLTIFLLDLSRWMAKKRWNSPATSSRVSFATVFMVVLRVVFLCGSSHASFTNKYTWITYKIYGFNGDIGTGKRITIWVCCSQSNWQFSTDGTNWFRTIFLCLLLVIILQRDNLTEIEVYKVNKAKMV